MSQEPATTKDMMKAMSRASKGTDIIGETKKTFAMASGKTKKGDSLLPLSDFAGAMAALKTMVEAAKQAAAGKKGGNAMWDFRSSPHAQFGKTLDDMFGAFLLWARLTPEDDDVDAKDSGQINVSAAFRRLEAYAEWMESTGVELIEPPLKCDEGMLKAFVDVGNICTTRAPEGQLIWWMDLGATDAAAVKASPVSIVFRAFVWYAHAIMYDTGAQQHGMVIVENLGSASFWSMMTMFPMELSTKLDRLTIGVLPVKMKLIMMTDPPRWMKMMMTIFGVFMSAKMKSRMVMFKKPDCWAAVREKFGAEAIPPSFGECNGTCKTDPCLDPWKR
jgi:hypothetical protein